MNNQLNQTKCGTDLENLKVGLPAEYHQTGKPSVLCVITEIAGEEILLTLLGEPSPRAAAETSTVWAYAFQLQIY